MSTLRALFTRAVVQRVRFRIRANGLRAIRALAMMGAGRLPGQILAVEVLPDRIKVHGWAALPGREVLGVMVTVNGISVALARVGLPTPIQSNGIPVTGRSSAAGWQTDVDRTKLGIEPLIVGAEVILGRGLSSALEPKSAYSVGALDLPRDGAVVVGRVLPVSGWFRTGAGFDHLEMRLNNYPVGRARLMSVPRPDVAALLGDADASLAGWDALVELPDNNGEEFIFTVEAVGPNGRRLIGESHFQAVDEENPIHDHARLQVLRSRSSSTARLHLPDDDGLNVLVITHHLGLGGGQLYLQDILRKLLIDSRVACTVFSSEDGALRDELELLGADVYVVGHPPTQSIAYEQWLNQLISLTGATGANVALANTAGSFWGVDLASRLKIPAVWAIHESFSPEVFLRVGFPSVPDDRMRETFLASFKTAAAIIFEADATLDLFDPLVRPDRALRIDYGIDLDAIESYRASVDRSAIRRKLGIDDDNTVLIISVGTYDARKAQGLLSMAFGAVSARFPQAILAMVGDAGGAYSAALHTVVDRLAMGDRIRLLPVTQDTGEWYLAADAFILGSDVESLPRSMLEAMAFGVPVLGSAVFGVPELIDDGVNGLLFKPSSARDAEGALRRFLQLSAEERQSLGIAGQELVEATRSSDIYASQYRDLLTALVADPNVFPKDVVFGREVAGKLPTESISD